MLPGIGQEILDIFMWIVNNNNNGMNDIGAGVSLIAGLGAAMGQGYIGGTALEALARNPEVEALILRQYIVGAAICESAAIYGLIIALILAFNK